MEREYQRTHPWITFRIPRPLAEQQKVWAMLGECQSKSEHIAGAPLDPDIATRLHIVYLAKGIRGTAAIEGNTLSEEEIVKKLEGRLRLPPSREYLAQEVENIINGLKEVSKAGIDGNAPPLTRSTIQKFNAILLQNLDLEEGVVPGEIRKNIVGVFNYRGAPAADCEYLLDRLCEWLNGPDFEGPGELRIALAIVKAIICHVYLAWIHPFGDGNGRTARLVEFDILFSAGMPTPAAHLLSNHYNLTRTEYYRQLDYASGSGGDLLPFIAYAVQGLLDGLREQLAVVRSSQIDKIWQNYVYEAFGNTRSPANLRRRLLVLELSKLQNPVRFAKLTSISAAIQIAYHGASKLKLNRDLNALQSMELIVRERNGTMANKDIIMAFLPGRAKERTVTPTVEDLEVMDKTTTPNVAA
jgi:Fic family protein